MNDVNQLEQQLSDAKELTDRRNMALKLAGNREFKKLILEDYLVKEAARLIGAAGDANLNLQTRLDMTDMGRGCGHLKRYLSAIVTMGGTAENDIPDIEQALAEARAEEDIPSNVRNIADGGELV